MIIEDVRKRNFCLEIELKMNFSETAEFLVSVIQHSNRVSIDLITISRMLGWLVVVGQFLSKQGKMHDLDQLQFS